MFGATTNRAESFFQNWTNGTSFHETNRETTVNSTSSTGGTVNAQAFTQQAHTIEVSRDGNTYGSAATTRLLLTSTSYSSSFSRDYSTSRYDTNGSVTSVSTTSFSGGDSGGVTNSNTSQTIVDSAGTGSTVSRRSDYTYLRGTNFTSVTSTDSSVFPYSFTFTGNEEETFTSWLSGIARIETLTSTEDRTLTVPSTVSTTAQSGTGSTSTTVSSLSLDCQFTYSTVATYTTRGPQGWTDDTSSPNSTDYYLSSGGSTSQKTAATTLTETILMSYADTSFHRMVDLYDVDALFAGEMAWLFKFTTPAGSLYTNTSAGFLTDFYSLQTANSFTLSHPRNYVTRSSVPNTIAYLSTTSLSGTNTVTVESYDGLVKPTVTNSSTYYYNSAATATSITSQTSAYLSGTWSTGSSSKTFLSHNLGVSQSFLDYQWTETIEGWVNVWTSSTLTTHFESRVEGVVFTTPSTTRSVGLISTTSQDWYFSLSTYTAVTHSPNTSLAILVNSNTSSSGISGSTASSASSGVVALTYFNAWPVVTITAYQSTNGANKAGRPRMQERIYGAGILGFGDGWTDELAFIRSITRSTRL
jgi:trimeric autotransporter adhesin